MDVCFDTPKRDYFIRNTTTRTTQNVILGRGSYGVVFKALYKGKKAAVKMIKKCDSYKFSSLSRERNILNFNHENIIKLLKIVETRDYGAIIMERFDCGKNLQLILNNCEKIDLKHRLKIVKDIVKALKFCHENNIIHRDLKPDNLMVIFDSESNEIICKLFDFGCSLKFTNNLNTNDYDMLNNNENIEDDINASIVGTVRYSAPELLQGFAPTKAIDVYSLGVMMWQLMENEIPYEAIKSNEVIVWQVVKNNLRPDSTRSLLPKLNQEEEIRKDNSNKYLQPNLLSLEDTKTFVKSFTPTKILSISSNRKPARSEFKHDKKFISRCAIKNSKNISRKKLFNSNFLDNLFDKENDTVDEILNVFIDSLTDHQPNLRKRDNACQIEKEYVELYKACWNENPSDRPIIEKIYNLIEEFINYL